MVCLQRDVSNDAQSGCKHRATAAKLCGRLHSVCALGNSENSSVYLHKCSNASVIFFFLWSLLLILKRAL